ncbi:MAG TPA: 2Fe-2S iron-sulfur cluster-binding protein [Thermoplasmata archaeon]|nr:2Fe-2S iron-sulfur cluster-binding protein [Thermoplasmata archaeon]
MTDAELTVRVNGRTERLADVPGDERLLDTLRWRLGLKGTKEGCRTGDCGACTVLVDGVTVLSCLTLAHDVADQAVTTVEHVADDPVGAGVVRAFQQAGALQCGYCTPGFVVALTGLLKERGTDAPTEELLEGLQGNLCRCTGYAAIARAVARVREELA